MKRLLIFAAIFLAGIRPVMAADIVELKDIPKSFAIVPDSGALATLAGDGSKVTLYPAIFEKGGLEGGVQCQVDGGCALAYKKIGDKSYLVVACGGDKSILLLNAATLAVVQKITLKESPQTVAAPLNANVPYLFYGHANRVGRIDLAKMADEGLSVNTVDPRPQFSDIGVNAEGTLIYGRDPADKTCPRRVTRLELFDGKLYLRDSRYLKSSIGPYYADPFGSLVAYEWLDRYETDPDNAAPDVKIPVKAFMTSPPAIVCLDPEGLHILSYNTHRELAKVEWEIKKTVDSISHTTVLVDEKGRNIIVCTQSIISRIALAPLKLPEESILAIQPIGVLSATPGEVLMIPIRTFAKCNVEIGTGSPDGVKLTSDQISWTPGEKDVGARTINLRLSAGGIERVIPLNVNVHRPMLPLPVAPSEVAVSPDGKLAFLVGRMYPKLDTHSDVPEPDETWLAVVDLEKRAVIAQRAYPKLVRGPTIAGEHAYVVENDGQIILALSAKDLSDQHKVFVKGRALETEAIGDRLYVWTGTAAMRYNADLTPIVPDAGPVSDNPAVASEERVHVPFRTESGWYWRGMLYDEKLEHVVLAQNDAGIYLLNGNQGFNTRMNTRGLSAPRWGVVISDNKIVRLPDQTVGALPGTISAILPDMPAAVTLGAEAAEKQLHRDEASVRLSLAFWDLAAANKKVEMALGVTDTARLEQNGTVLAGAKIFAAPGRVVLSVGKELYILETSALDKQLFPDPPALTVDASTTLLPADKPTSLQFKAHYLKEPVTYSLAFETKGVSMDAKTGSVTFDPTVLITDEQMRNIVLQILRTSTAGSDEEKLNEYLAKNRERFAALSSQKPAGLVVAVHVTPVAKDGQGQEATVKTVVFIDVPTEQFRKQIAVVTGNANHPRVPPTRPATEPNDVQAQIDQLQKENAQMRAQIKLLKEMAAETKTPATKP